MPNGENNDVRADAQAPLSLYQSGALAMREIAAKLVRECLDNPDSIPFKFFNIVSRDSISRISEAICDLSLPNDPASSEGTENLVGKMREAAERIAAAKNAEIATLWAALDKAQGAMTCAAYTLRNLPTDNPHTQHAWKDAVELEIALYAIKRASSTAANARIAALTEALMPFADYGVVINEPDDQTVYGRGYRGNERHLRASDFRRAARLLPPSTKQTESVK